MVMKYKCKRVKIVEKAKSLPKNMMNYADNDIFLTIKNSVNLTLFLHTLTF